MTVNDLSGTDVNQLNVDLAGSLGGTSGDGQADRIIVNGTNGDDTIDVDGDASGVAVSGLVPTIHVFHSQVANDRLEIGTLEGIDSVSSGRTGRGRDPAPRRRHPRRLEDPEGGGGASSPEAPPGARRPDTDRAKATRDSTVYGQRHAGPASELCASRR